MMRIITFCTLICFLSSCNKQKDSDEQQEATQTSYDTIRVTSYTSSFEKLTYPVKAIGKIRSARRSNLIFEQSGIIQSINVTSGDWVKRGKVIATLRNQEEYLQKENAQIALKRALVAYENEMLALGDSTYYKEHWAKVKENVELNTGVLAAKVSLKQAELAYKQTIIRAPISGIIEGIDLQSGDFVSSNLSLGSIYDPETFEVTCDVLEYDVLKIERGMHAVISPLSEVTMKLDGVVTAINPAVDRKGLSRILIRIKNPDGIIPGMSARVEINVTDEPSIVIPKQAVVKRSERHVVFNIDNGLAKWNYVTLGKDNGEKVQILEGIEEDMEIIISNNLQLAHDSPVKLE